MHKWQYRGDVDLREGGLFWKEDDADDYVLAVEVIPCSAAGGPDNLFWINEGSIYITPERAKSALEGYGTAYADATRADIVEAIMSHYGMESDIETKLRIGPREPDPDNWRFDSSNFEEDVVLRAGSKLENWVKRECLG
jgi:hypothetical protein